VQKKALTAEELMPKITAQGLMFMHRQNIIVEELQ
jgi:hypothetical protein